MHGGAGDQHIAQLLVCKPFKVFILQFVVEGYKYWSLFEAQIPNQLTEALICHSFKIITKPKSNDDDDDDGNDDGNDEKKQG